MAASNIKVRLDAPYPSIQIYAPVYPHLSIYPEQVVRKRTVDSRMTVARNLATYPDIVVYPALVSPAGASIKATGFFTLSTAGYPWLVIYAPVYPHIVVYPEPAARMATGTTFDMNVSLWSVYPYSAQRVYVPGYPDNMVIYPEIDRYRARSHLFTAIQPSYPYFQVYAPQYPYLEIYPAVKDVSPVAVASPQHQHQHHLRVESPYRHRHVRSDLDVPPVPPLPADILAKYRASSPITPPPDVLSSTHIRINGHAVEEQGSRQSASIRQRRWKNSHLDLHMQVFGSSKWKHSHHDLHMQVYDSDPRGLSIKATTQILAPYDTSLQESSPKSPTVHSMQPPARGRSGTVVGRPVLPPTLPAMVPVGRLNMSKYGFA